MTGFRQCTLRPFGFANKADAAELRCGSVEADISAPDPPPSSLLFRHQGSNLFSALLARDRSGVVVA
jgi:hypothetical protein